jgi:hypothetical protein
MRQPLHCYARSELKEWTQLLLDRKLTKIDRHVPKMAVQDRYRISNALRVALRTVFDLPRSAVGQQLTIASEIVQCMLILSQHAQGPELSRHTFGIQALSHLVTLCVRAPLSSDEKHRLEVVCCPCPTALICRWHTRAINGNCCSLHLISFWYAVHCLGGYLTLLFLAVDCAGPPPAAV